MSTSIASFINTSLIEVEEIYSKATKSHSLSKIGLSVFDSENVETELHH